MNGADNLDELAQIRAAMAGAMNWEALAGKQPPPRDWVEPDWLGMGHPTLCAGKGGTGKTLLAQMIQSAYGLARPYLGPAPEGRDIRPRVCMLWACEDDHDELWRRQVAIAEYFRVPLSDFAASFIIVPRLGQDNTLLTTEYGKPMWTPAMSELSQMVCDYKVEVLAVDNVAQTCASANDAHSVTKFCNAFAGIGSTAGIPTSTVLLHHPSRADGSEFGGAAAWENAVRMRWYLANKLPDQVDDEDHEPDDNVRYLCKRKTNYSAKDYIRFTYRDGVLVPNDADPRARTDARYRADIAEGIVLKSLQQLRGMGRLPTDGTTSPDYLPKLIVEFKLNENMAKKDLASGMRSLMVAGKLRRDIVGTYANRAPRYGLVL